MTSPGVGLPAGAGGLGGVVQADAVQGFPGDLLGAVQDGVHGRAADEVGQAADHPVGALVQVGVQLQELAGLVAVQSQGLLEGGDQRLPLLALGGGPVGEGLAGDHAEPAGDLPAAGPGEQAAALDVDARVDEGRRDPLGQVLQLVGCVGAGAGGQVEVVDLVDEDQVGAEPGQHVADRVGDLGLVLAGLCTGSPAKRANSTASIFGVAAGGTVT